MNSQTAISLFSNCGAGDVGYRKAGFRFEVMAELEKRRLDVALLNHSGATGVAGDLNDTWEDVVKEFRARSKNKRPALLCACPPCQGMSSARGKRGKGDDPDAGNKDERNLLVEVIYKVAAELKPRIIVVENVPAFLTRKVWHPDHHKTKAISAAKLLVSRLRGTYSVFPVLLDLADYGVPQTRKRTFLTFIHNEEPGLERLLKKGKTPFPLPTHARDLGGERHITLRHALEEYGLPELDARTPERAVATIGKGLHQVPVWNDARYDMVAAIPPGSGQSAWENDECPQCGTVEVENQDATCPHCNEPLLRPVVQEEDGSYRLVSGFRSSSYRRVRPDQPAATITTASGHLGSHFTIHPFENRLFSPLECALIQTFPKRFKWGDSLESWGVTKVREMIGEAVPPLFTQFHGQVLAKVLHGNWYAPTTENLLPMSDIRYKRAAKKLGIENQVSLQP